MTIKNLGKAIRDKEIDNVHLSPKMVEKLYKSRHYHPNLTNKTMIRIPWEASNYKGWGISFADVVNMNIRMNDFINSYGKEPNYVWVIPETPSPIKPTGEYLKAFENAFGQFTDVKSAIEKFRNRGYHGYLNAYEIYHQGKENGNVLACYERTKNKIHQNCCDYTAMLVLLILEQIYFYKMKYEVEVLQIKCQKETHLLFQVKGNEFGNDWVIIDPAAMASTDSPYCNQGKVCWCAYNGKPRKICRINPDWFKRQYANDFNKFPLKPEIKLSDC